MKKELKTLAAVKTSSILRCKDEASLMTFSWKKLHDELLMYAPTFLSVLKTIFSDDENKMKNELPAILSAAGILISVHNREMSALEYINSMILLKGGAKKSAFRRLNATHMCMSYCSTMDKANTIADNAENKLHEWQTTSWNDRQRELQLIANMESLEGHDNDSVLIRAHLENELKCLRAVMHPGYYIVGDNADLRTHVRHHRLGYGDQDVHMFQIAAYKIRVPGHHLDPRHPLGDIRQIPFSSVIPSPTDHENLMHGMAIQVANTWVTYLKPFQHCQMAKRTHQYIELTRKKTERVRSCLP